MCSAAEHTNIKTLLLFFKKNKKWRVLLNGCKAGCLLSGKNCLSSPLLRFAERALVIFQKLAIKTHLLSHFFNLIFFNIRELGLYMAATIY